MSLWRRLEQKALQASNDIQAAIQRSKPDSAATRDVNLDHQEAIGLIERQRRLTPFNSYSGRVLFPTDPPALAYSNGIPVQREELNEQEWQLQVVAGVTDVDGWTYAINWNFTFQAKETTKAFVRKRFWIPRTGKDRGESHPALTAGVRGWIVVGAQDLLEVVAGERQEDTASASVAASASSEDGRAGCAESAKDGEQKEEEKLAIGLNEDACGAEEPNGDAAEAGRSMTGGVQGGCEHEMVEVDLQSGEEKRGDVKDQEEKGDSEDGAMSKAEAVSKADAESEAEAEEGAERSACSEDGAVMGEHGRVECMHALFGREVDVTGRLVWADPPLADTTLQNASALHNAIAVVLRDPEGKLERRVGFVDKAMRVVEAGAVGVIVVNYAEKLLAPWRWTNDQCTDISAIRVPVVCVRESAAALLADGAQCRITLSHQRDVDAPHIGTNLAHGEQRGPNARGGNSSDEGGEGGEATATASASDEAGWVRLVGFGQSEETGEKREGGPEAMEWAAEESEEWGGSAGPAVGSRLQGAVHKTLRDLEEELGGNLRFFSAQSAASATKEPLRICSSAIVLVQEMKPLAQAVAEQAFLHDLPGVSGNGYWSLMRVLDCCLSRLLAKVKALSSERDTVFFSARSSTLVKAVVAYLDIFNILKELFEATLEFSKVGAADASAAGGENEEFGGGEGAKSLFFTDVSLVMVNERIDKLDLSVLYGDKFGYQYTYRLRHFLRAIILTAASYSKSYSKHAEGHVIRQLASTYMHGVEYLMRPAKRGERVLEQYNQGDISFVKSFWNLTELPVATKFGAVVGASVDVCHVMAIDCSQPLEMPKVGGGAVDVAMFPDREEMKALCGAEYELPDTIATRLISYWRLPGQLGGESSMPQMQLPQNLSWTRKPRPPSPHLIVHFHGGGFIAQSSASHEVYLRDWAKGLEAPILSVDYGLAPEHPFPLAVEQGFFAYCWALKNASLLGSTAESVICVGDSAGANLAAVVALRAIEEGVRPPSGVVMLYPALFLHDTPSPSRIISLMDPLLPLGTLQMCMHSYASHFIEEHAPIMSSLHLDPTLPPHGVSPATRRRIHHLSPLLAPPDLLASFPPCVVLASELDPLLDDAVMFARRMRDLKRSSDFKLKVVPLLPHGWLNMYFVGDRTSLNASNEVVVCMKQMLANGVAESRSPLPRQAPPKSEEEEDDNVVQAEEEKVQNNLWFPGEELSTPTVPQ